MARESTRRILGLPLKAAARLMETPGPRALLVRVAEGQFGIAALRDRDVPTDLAPYVPHHLGKEGE
ncbi:MAG: hypothetical protein JRH20_14605 [Deltaproteobacteria bacterium]|nr:hypothetical protein [Deltaproteobacteria bacterium]